jgi:hypothetical protein
MTSPVVLNHRGTPEPSSDIQRRLAAVHPRLSLKYIDGADQHWAITMRWDDHDPRWGMVQSQELDPNRSMDIIGYLPMDCGAEEAPSYLGRALRQYPKDDVQQLADRVLTFNETVPMADAVNAAIAEVLDNPDPSGTAKRRGRSPKGKS